jgi:hypothetical protein
MALLARSLLYGHPEVSGMLLLVIYPSRNNFINYIRFEFQVKGIRIR